MNMVSSVVSLVPGATVKEVLRCIQLSTTVIYRDGHTFMCDDKYVYCLSSNNTNSSSFRKFYKEINSLRVGKLFHTNNPKLFTNHMKTIDKSSELYRFVK